MVSTDSKRRVRATAGGHDRSAASTRYRPASDANEPPQRISHRFLPQTSGVTTILTTAAASALRDPDSHRLRRPMAPPDRRRSNGQLENAEITTSRPDAAATSAGLEKRPL